MMYRVIEYFTDLQDGGHAYSVGDNFPREGVQVSDDRLKELSGADNKRGKPLIKAVEAQKTKEEPAEAEEPAEQPKKKGKRS